MNCSQDGGGEHEKNSKFRQAPLGGGIVEVGGPHFEKLLYLKVWRWGTASSQNMF
jgi:hypothetical protein